MVVYGAGSGQGDTTNILSKPDNTGSTYKQYLNEILQDLEKREERWPPLNKNIAKLFQNLV